MNQDVAYDQGQWLGAFVRGSNNHDGDIFNYYPDFLVKLSDKRVVIVETKGQEDLDVTHKMERLRQWCEDINRVQADVEYDFVYADQESFERYKPNSFRQLLESFREYKEKILPSASPDRQ